MAHQDWIYVFGKGSPIDTQARLNVRRLIEERKQRYCKAPPSSPERRAIVDDIIRIVVVQNEGSFQRLRYDGTIIDVPERIARTHLQTMFSDRKGHRRTSRHGTPQGAQGSRGVHGTIRSVSSKEETNSIVASVTGISADSSLTGCLPPIQRNNRVVESLLPPGLVPLPDCHVESVLVRLHTNPSTGATLMLADLQCKCDNPKCARAFHVRQEFSSVITCPFCNPQESLPYNHGTVSDEVLRLTSDQGDLQGRFGGPGFFSSPQGNRTNSANPQTRLSKHDIGRPPLEIEIPSRRILHHCGSDHGTHKEGSACGESVQHHPDGAIDETPPGSASQDGLSLLAGAATTESSDTKVSPNSSL